MPGYPYTSWIVLTSMIIIISSMPFIPGQSSGLIAGFIILALYSSVYLVKGLINNSQKNTAYRRSNDKRYEKRLLAEFSKELNEGIEEKDKNK